MSSLSLPKQAKAVPQAMVRLLASKHMAVSHACVETLEHRLCTARTHSAKSCMWGMSRLLLTCGDGCPCVPAAQCVSRQFFFLC
jgi:hypothetical protein